MELHERICNEGLKQDDPLFDILCFIYSIALLDSNLVRLFSPSQFVFDANFINTRVLFKLVMYADNSTMVLASPFKYAAVLF